LHMQKLVLI